MIFSSSECRAGEYLFGVHDERVMNVGRANFHSFDSVILCVLSLPPNGYDISLNAWTKDGFW